MRRGHKPHSYAPTHCHHLSLLGRTPVCQSRACTLALRGALGGAPEKPRGAWPHQGGRGRSIAIRGDEVQQGGGVGNETFGENLPFPLAQPWKESGMFGAY